MRQLPSAPPGCLVQCGGSSQPATARAALVAPWLATPRSLAGEVGPVCCPPVVLSVSSSTTGCVCGCCPLLFAAAAAAAAQATQPMRSSGVYLCCAACCTQAPAGARQSGPTRAWGSTGSEGGVSGCTSDVLSYCSVLLCLAHAACAWPPCELDLAVGSSLRGGPRTCCQLHERPTASLVVLYLPPAACSTGCAACSSGRHHMQVLRGAASATGWLNGLCAVARGCGFTKHATALPARQTPFLRC